MTVSDAPCNIEEDNMQRKTVTQTLKFIYATARKANKHITSPILFTFDVDQTLSTKPTPSIVADDASVVAPGQFLDFLTGDLMQKPVKLPSGNYVDRSNLIQFWRQRQVNDPNAEPVDPFTMVPLDETKLVCDAQFRSSIEIYRHLWEQLDRFCSTLDRAEPVSSPIRTLPLHESSSDEATLEDGSDILRRYPHLMVSEQYSSKKPNISSL
ncbi:hypothetical protein FGIG_00839 [Fasciola gigantica]|uniref:U-box domain-containing protein n=1 Tax=Fasciola gigantica TaxID=46835 RepID=A0A504YPV1_FASGI|nr:hypothetical protein FGIG_00839 [Fasciola gigantica]